MSDNIFCSVDLCSALLCSVDQIQGLQARRELAAQRPTCFSFPVCYFSARCLLCVDNIATSVGCGGVVPGGQQVHQLTVLNLLRLNVI